MKNILIESFKRPITKEQCKDTGMAMVLLLLILSLVLKPQSLLLVKVALAALVLDMVHPPLYRPVAVVWLGLSHLIGTVMSKLMLTLVFFGVVTPIGLARRLLGYDSLELKGFKAGEESVMAVRNHTFTGPDIEKPY
jgi:hypothetical protein